MVLKKDGESPKRFYRGKSLRLPKHDYSWSRAYFVTGCAITRDPIFEIPALHAILQDTWNGLPGRFPGVTLDEFVIMPDRIHGLLRKPLRAPSGPCMIFSRLIFISLLLLSRHISRKQPACDIKSLWMLFHSYVFL